MKLAKEEQKRRGALLKELRERRGLTQPQVVMQLDPDDPINFIRRYQRWESGGSWETFAEPGLALFFGVELDYFRRGAGLIKPNDEPKPKKKETAASRAG